MSARAHYQYSRNQPSDQKRNLKPTVSSQGAYSASPSQLTLSSDIPSAGLPNPYHQPYPYVPNPHDPSAFAFPQPGYRPPLQAQPPPHHQQPPPPHAPQVSPSNSRKRRASELGGGDQQNLQGPPSNNASPFTNPTGLVPGPGGDMNVGMGPPQQQQQQQHAQPSPAPKKGRTNTPWTPAEEQRLKTMRDAGSSWSEIAKTFPTRTEGSVKKHWYKVRLPLLLSLSDIDFPYFTSHVQTLTNTSSTHRTCITPISPKTRSATSFASPARLLNQDLMLTAFAERRLTAGHQRLREQQMEGYWPEGWQTCQGVYQFSRFHSSLSF